MTRQMTLAEALEVADKGEDGQWSVLVSERTAALTRLAGEVRSVSSFRDMGTEIPEAADAAASADDWQAMLEAPGFKLSLGARTAIALRRRVKELESAVRLDTELPQPHEAVEAAEAWHDKLRRGADATSAARAAIVLLNMLRLTEDRLKEADLEIQSLRAQEPEEHEDTGLAVIMRTISEVTGRQVSVVLEDGKWSAWVHHSGSLPGFGSELADFLDSAVRGLLRVVIERVSDQAAETDVKLRKLTELE